MFIAVIQLNSESNYRRRWQTPQCPHLSIYLH